MKYENTFKAIDQILWKEQGCGSELDYLEQKSWMLFLKYLDDLETEREEEAELDEIVKLVGMDALSANDRLKMETARSIREDFLHQLAFHEVDTYTSLKKQLYMMKLILNFNDEAAVVLEKGADAEAVASLPVREKIGRFKYIREEDTDAEFDKLSVEISAELNELLNKEDD